MKHSPCLQNDNRNKGKHTILKMTLSERYFICLL